MIQEQEPIGNLSAKSDGSWGDLQYDHRSSKVTWDPYNLWSRLRDECPVIHSTAYGGFWFVSRYEDVRSVLTDVDHFTAADGVTLPAEPMRLLPLESDPPIQRKYRQVFSALLAPHVVREAEPGMRALARQMLAPLAAQGRFDIYDFAEPYGHTVSMKAVGFPESALHDLHVWTTVMNSPDRDAEAGHQAGEAMMGFLNAALEERLAEADPPDDILTRIARGEVEGRPLGRDEQISLLALLIFGGFHTSGATITGALAWLADHPGDRVRLRRSPELMATAIDEFVRYVSPVSHMRRTTTADIEMGGCPIHKGEAVQFGLASANRDSSVFDKADDVLLDRLPNPHLGFGAGPHRCIGSHLGKLAVQVAIEEFLKLIPEFEIEDHGKLRWFSSEGRSLVSVPIIVRSA